MQKSAGLKLSVRKCLMRISAQHFLFPAVFWERWQRALRFVGIRQFISAPQMNFHFWTINKENCSWNSLLVLFNRVVFLIVCLDNSGSQQNIVTRKEVSSECLETVTAKSYTQSPVSEHFERFVREFLYSFCSWKVKVHLWRWEKLANADNFQQSHCLSQNTAGKRKFCELIRIRKSTRLTFRLSLLGINAVHRQFSAKRHVRMNSATFKNIRF